MCRNGQSDPWQRLACIPWHGRRQDCKGWLIGYHQWNTYATQSLSITKDKPYSISTYFVGRETGSRVVFSSSSFIRSNFHLLLLVCQIPKANVTPGIILNERIEHFHLPLSREFTKWAYFHSLTKRRIPPAPGPLLPLLGSLSNLKRPLASAATDVEAFLVQ